METLKDIKNVLKNIPDEVLGGMFFGIGENAEETVGLIALETGTISPEQIGFPEVWDRYPELVKIDKLVQNIKKAQRILDDQEKAEELSEQLQQEGITDTFFDKLKEVKPNSSHD